MEQRISRRECEDRILDKLLEIQAIYKEFAPEDDRGVCTVVGKNSVSAFAFERDEEGEAIEGKYTLNASEYKGIRTYD